MGSFECVRIGSGRQGHDLQIDLLHVGGQTAFAGRAGTASAEHERTGQAWSDPAEEYAFGVADDPFDLPELRVPRDVP